MVEYNKIRERLSRWISPSAERSRAGRLMIMIAAAKRASRIRQATHKPARCVGALERERALLLIDRGYE